MSRAHAVAPIVGVEAPFRGPVKVVRPAVPRAARHLREPTTSCYLERAMLAGQSPAITDPTYESAGCDSGRVDADRGSLRVVGNERGNVIEAKDRLPA